MCTLGEAVCIWTSQWSWLTESDTKLYGNTPVKRSVVPYESI